MKALEKENKARLNIQAIVLGVVATAGILSVALAAPGIFQVVKTFRNFRTAQIKAQYRYSINLAVRQLQKKGLLGLEKRNGAMFYQLTQKGKLELARYRAKEKIVKKQRWDKKWRVVIFDVKEARRNSRNRFRDTLRDFGFIKLQNSVWITPDDCEEVVDLLKVDLMLGKEVVYMRVNEISNEAWLKNKFGFAE